MQVSAANRQSVEASASNGPSPDEHVVKAGESLSGIAAERGVSLNALLAANPQIVNPNVIRTGQVVNLPPREDAGTYVVKPGDTLSAIGAKLGVPWQAIAQANNLRDPDLIRPEQQLTIPDAGSALTTARPTPANDAQPEVQTATTAPANDQRIGALSEQYESGGRGPGTVSSGAGDPGGVSYGTYQLAGNMNRPQEFLANEGSRWAAEFGGARPGTAAFTAAWREIAAREPEAFEAAQHDYIQRTHYQVQADQVQTQTGVDVTNRSAALRDVVWSTSVQHGPETQVVARAMANVQAQGVTPTDGQTYDRALINAIYDERGRRDAGGGLAYFSSSSASVQASVANRFAEERRDALNMLNP
jgi:LysM repeat protein